jgi:tRNA(Ile)-lysidine synthase
LNHLLRGEESARDARAVEQLVSAWAIPFTSAAIDVPALARAEKRSLEDAARVARYQFLRSIAPGARIAVAHHADDQVETLLLHWVRGSGLSGLVGMPPRQQDIIRPLLEVTHAETLAYCAEHAIVPIEDHSNSDPRFLRNRLRHEVLPLLRELNPGLQRTLLRNAEVIRVDLDWLEAGVDEHWHEVITSEQPTEISLSTRALLELPLSLQRHLLRRASALLCAGQTPLEPRHLLLLERLLEGAERSRQERELHLPLSLRARVQAGELLLSRRSDFQAADAYLSGTSELSLPIPGSALLPGTPWRVEAEIISDDAPGRIGQALQQEDWSELWRLLSPPTADMVYIDGENVGAHLLVRTRRPGDRIQPLGMMDEKKVQDVFVDKHITRSARATTPLFFSDKHCLWVAGACLDHRVRLTARARRILRLSITRMEHPAEG